MPKILLLLILTSFICTAGIIFQKEAITATIAACDTLEVQGVYYFVNSDTSTTSTAIYYPFPVDSVLNYPYYISVVRLSNKKQLSYIKRKMGITWKQILPPRSTDSIQVIYRQKTMQPNGRYILTTTKYWKSPLKRADFTVITPADITLSYWSFQSDSVGVHNGRIYYHSFQTDFFPESDMLLEWKCR
jgi:hypothetical protein